MNTITLKSQDIHCASCAASIEKVVGALEGVRKVEVDIDGQAATVQFEPPATTDSISSAMEEAGFDVQPDR
jgi:Cu+-exporting ATPase